MLCRRRVIVAAQHVRFNTSGVGPHGTRVERKVHHADIPHPRFLVEPKKCAIVGAPMTWGQPRAGTDDGPNWLRKAGLHKELDKLGWSLDDGGDIDIQAPSSSDPKGDPKHIFQMKNCYAVGRGCEQVYNRVAKEAADGKFVLTIGNVDTAHA